MPVPRRAQGRLCGSANSLALGRGRGERGNRRTEEEKRREETTTGQRASLKTPQAVSTNQAGGLSPSGHPHGSCCRPGTCSPYLGFLTSSSSRSSAERSRRERRRQKETESVCGDQGPGTAGRKGKGRKTDLSSCPNAQPCPAMGQSTAPAQRHHHEPTHSPRQLLTAQPPRRVDLGPKSSRW